MAETDELLRSEEAGWTELRSLLGSLTPEQLAIPGYFEEGWSAKDLLAHIGSWLAEAGVLLEQIRAGSYRRDEVNVDELNAKFLEAMKDVPLPTVRAQAAAARTQMRHALAQLPEVTPPALFWVRKAGAEHYQEHLPQLREWMATMKERSAVGDPT
jgi:mycothiol maleylpyruvate isomerase-like protein